MDLHWDILELQDKDINEIKQFAQNLSDFNKYYIMKTQNGGC